MSGNVGVGVIFIPVFGAHRVVPEDPMRFARFLKG